ncbi:hypothetical protein BJY04DRAFT_187216 [Aspergillus karnatakaensis]|uniref:uncharacterized protein n=1 Tax=Aspergillus karnatakaensis TaxID=1810916 RepID=UPI003CCDAF7B
MPPSTYTRTHHSTPSPPTHPPTTTFSPTPTPPIPSQMPAQPATCRVCRYPLIQLRVKGTNPKNANRPYFRCERCGKFRGWADNEGVYSENPLCHCGVFSRVDTAGWERGGGLFYACASGGCQFWAGSNWRDSENGGQNGGRGGGSAYGNVHEM